VCRSLIADRSSLSITSSGLITFTDVTKKLELAKKNWHERRCLMLVAGTSVRGSLGCSHCIFHLLSHPGTIDTTWWHHYIRPRTLGTMGYDLVASLHPFEFNHV
jgi:hypothetical protein